MENDLDTPETESSLNLDQAAAAFAQMLDPQPQEGAETTEPEAPAPDTPAENNAAEEGDDAAVTVEVDGKPVTLTKEQIAEAYKSGLRQSDYTQKTMAVAEQRKAAEAETLKAQQERSTYASNLQKMAAQLEGALEQQSKIDWNALIESNPVEALRQQHLLQQRQAALQENQREQQRLAEQIRSEQAEAFKNHLSTQQQELLAKLPEWKDEAKASAERDALKAYLVEQGYSQSDVANISDHKAVILGRKAMLYDQMMAKAQAAAKKVSNVPTKVERPGVSSERVSPDGRSAAMQRLTKSGRVEDAAAVFASIL